MNRRPALALIGTTAMAGTIGCLQSLNFRQKNRLWYVVIRNGLNSATVDLRIRRNQDIVHDQTYTLAGAESYENPNNEARFVAGVPYVRFQKATWNTDLGQFSLEYKLGHQTNWNRESFSDVKTRNVGATINVGSREDIIAGVRVHEHESEADAKEIIEYVENERENHSHNMSI